MDLERKALIQYKLQKIKCFLGFHSDGKLLDDESYITIVFLCPYCNKIYWKLL